jgi:Zn-finger nucleic acid-binding protein
MNCPCCSAPLAPGGVVCAYCGQRLDVDLQGWTHLQRIGVAADLQCPDCRTNLESVQLDAPAGARLDRCPDCLGLFLPLGSLNTLLDAATGPVWTIDRRLLNQLVEAPRSAPTPLRYRPCPSCGILMNRSLQGKRSGVVVDRCRDHGVWLDAGELRQLLEWARAGGAQLDAQRREQQAAEEQERRPLVSDVGCEASGGRSSLDIALDMLGWLLS